MNERHYNFAFIRNNKDNVISVQDSYTWEELVELCAEHQVVENKDTMMFCPALFKTEDYIPAARKIYAGNQIVGNDILYDSEGNTQIARDYNNVISYSALLLDFDHGEHLLETIEQLSGIRHLGYTSYNHLVPDSAGGTHEKFRVVVPFADDCPLEEFSSRRGAQNNPHEGSILAWLGKNVDPCCLTRSRFFYVPSCSLLNRDKAMVWHEDGELLDWRVFERAPVVKEQKRKIKPVEGGKGPIIFESFDIVEFMKDQGLYVRQSGGGKHDVQCPNEAAHSHRGIGGTVVYEGGGHGWPTFYCAHLHCRKFDFWKHFRETLGSKWMHPYCQRGEELTIDTLILNMKGPKNGN